jgi:DNA-directed RNA polymerase subunit RPC12/RpoP
VEAREAMRGAAKLLIYLVSIVLVFFGLVFMISVNLGIAYFFIGIAFLVVAGVLVFAAREKKPLEIKQTVTVTGAIKAKEVRCPNCNAIVDPTQPEVVEGKPYVTCSYCGKKFELTEEPTW